MPDTQIKIRPLRENEKEIWHPLWKGYQGFYGVDIAEDISDVTWQRFHSDAEDMFLLGAFENGKLLGIVHYLYHRSTWTVGNYCYLQDLFTVEEARGKGVGRALIEAVYEEAKAAECSRVYWLTQEGNSVARVLYDRVADASGFVQYRKLFEPLKPS